MPGILRRGLSRQDKAHKQLDSLANKESKERFCRSGSLKATASKDNKIRIYSLSHIGRQKKMNCSLDLS